MTNKDYENKIEYLLREILDYSIIPGSPTEERNNPVNLNPSDKTYSYEFLSDYINNFLFPNSEKIDPITGKISYRILDQSDVVMAITNQIVNENSTIKNIGALSDAYVVESAIGYLNQILGDKFVPSSYENADITFGKASLNEGLGENRPYFTDSDLLVDHNHDEIWLDETKINKPGNSLSDEEKVWVVLHEILHSFGLTDFEDWDEQTSQKYTIMSYRQHDSFRDLNADPNDPESKDESVVFRPTTLMLHDYLALQKLGWDLADQNTGDTTHLYDELDGATQKKYLETIKDDSGTNDTLSAGNHTHAVTLDLRQGHFSSVGAATNNTNNGRAVENVAIAYGTIIENATGGAGDDVLIGNIADNVLKGNAGDDLMFGDGGSYDGSDGWWDINDPDKPVTDGGTGDGSGNDILIGGAGSDHLVGGAGNDTLYAANEDTTGDAAGDRNTLEGGAGDDTFYSSDNGSDTLIGGDGNDDYRVTLGYNTTGKFTVDTIVDSDAGKDDFYFFVGATFMAPKNVDVQLVAAFN